MSLGRGVTQDGMLHACLVCHSLVLWKFLSHLYRCLIGVTQVCLQPPWVVASHRMHQRNRHFQKDKEFADEAYIRRIFYHHLPGVFMYPTKIIMVMGKTGGKRLTVTQLFSLSLLIHFNSATSFNYTCDSFS